MVETSQFVAVVEVSSEKTEVQAIIRELKVILKETIEMLKK